MALYDPVNGVYRKVKKKYDPVEGVYRKVTKAYDSVDGVYRQYFSGDTPVSTLAVGDSVWLNVDGELTEFLVVNQGRPSSLYHASCIGTWLLMKDAYTSMKWDSFNNDYANSDVHTYLNGTFLNLLSTTVKSAIKQAKIPYVTGTGTNGSVASGSSGLSTKIFLLSGYEVGITTANNLTTFADGAKLSYFISGETTTAANDKRVCYDVNHSSTIDWWLRSAIRYYANYTEYVKADGKLGVTMCTYTFGIRPALILDSNTPIDNSTGKNIIA